MRCLKMVDPCVIVTGASKGIGAAIAVELDKRGLPVLGLSRSGQAVAGDAFVCDMTNEDQVRERIGSIGAQRGIATLVNNAGLYIGSPIAELSSDQYDQVMNLNAKAVMIASREAYPYLKGHGGKIVNIGSFFDKMGVPHNLPYCASKAAVAAMTRCMAVEWAHDGIGVIDVAPGYIETDLNADYLGREKIQEWLAGRVPTGGPGKPEDVARLVAALICEEIPFLTGETIYIDGGQGMNH